MTYRMIEAAKTEAGRGGGGAVKRSPTSRFAIAPRRRQKAPELPDYRFTGQILGAIVGGTPLRNLAGMSSSASGAYLLKSAASASGRPT